MSTQILGDETLSEDELRTLEADSPTLAKTLRSLQTAIVTQSDKVERLAARQDAELARERAEVSSEIQTAIDSNPTLAAWQTAQDQTRWIEATRLDKVLRESPAYADVPFSDRFAKVVEMTQKAFDADPRREEETPLRAAEREQEKVVKNLDTISAAELGAKFLGLGDPDAIQTYLANLAR
jgi:hypothetical protein